MMKIRLIPQLAFATVLLSVTLVAPESQAITRVKAPPEVGQLVFQADLGIAGSFEDFTENSGLGWSLGVTYHADRALGIGITFGKARTSDVDVISITSYPSRNIKDGFSYIAAVVQVRAPTRENVIPRVQTGFGYYMFDITSNALSDGRLLEKYDEGAFGMFFGLGVDFLVSPNVSFGVVGNYHFASIDDTSHPLTSTLGDWYDNWEIKGVLSFYSR